LLKKEIFGVKEDRLSTPLSLYAVDQFSWMQGA